MRDSLPHSSPARSEHSSSRTATGMSERKTSETTKVGRRASRERERERGVTAADRDIGARSSPFSVGHVEECEGSGEQSVQVEVESGRSNERADRCAERRQARGGLQETRVTRLAEDARWRDAATCAGTVNWEEGSEAETRRVESVRGGCKGRKQTAKRCSRG